ncbi:MAG: ABC transporter permease subunit [Gemmatimonadaceae bacterium]|nr:ABC transporter permease subunit [Gemmatimonadaceae bacterium]
MTAVALQASDWRPAGAWRVAKPQVRNVVRSKWLAYYFGFFALVTEGLIRFTGGDARTLLSLANLVLFVVPLVTVVYGTIYLYNSREFIELLLAQPLKRRTLFGGLYVGLAVPLIAALVAGIMLPFIVHGLPPEQRMPLTSMLVGAAALIAVFTGIAFCIALRFEDRLTGLGAGMAIWLLMAFVYDGLLLMAVALLSDHSIERSLLAASLANPIDLVRIALLLQFDVSALMGYTGAVFRHFFSYAGGEAVIAIALSAWVAVPLGWGFVAFNRKDF